MAATGENVAVRAITRSRWFVPGLLVSGVAGLLSPLPTIVRFAAAVAFGIAIFRMGTAMLGGLARPIPGPPPDGEMRRVNLRYRCSVCGAEMRMTKAANHDPDPPRHCMDEMDLVSTGEE